MAPSIKLIYFAGRGRGELPRMILAAAGMEYENVRIKVEDWAAEKQNMPFGVLPVLEYDGLKMSQSIAMSRYLAKKANLYGKTEEDQARGDMVVDMLSDYYEALKKVWFTTNEEEKKERAEKCMQEDMPKFLRNCEKALEMNGKKNHFAGDSLTWADIAIFEAVSNLVSRTAPTYTRRMPWDALSYTAYG